MKRPTELGGHGDFVSAQLTDRPTLLLDCDPADNGLLCVSVRNLPRDVIGPLSTCSRAARLLRSALRVRVIGPGAEVDQDLPDIFGRHHVLKDGIRFIPRFRFEAGVWFRATFDPEPLACPQLAQVLTLEFSVPRETSAERTYVKHVFPSADSLPENLLRFYACFSGPMQRGGAEAHITLLGPDGRPAPDVLYRPPVELWDTSMRCLTILLDPGRLKRGVGPNRALGPPLQAGEEYTLVIGPGVVDMSDHPLREAFSKSFHVTEAVRNPIDIERWTISHPAAHSQQPLELMFPAPLDWAQLWRGITVAAAGDSPIDGRIAVDRGERRWSFTPSSPWASGSYNISVASGLEDVCGNSLLAAFDRPLRGCCDPGREVTGRSIFFRL
jgi:hypothetical protein